MYQISFQSTFPAWGATTLIFVTILSTSISIHAPRMGSDVPNASITTGMAHFNPRSPHGERPFRKRRHDRRTEISIHAPRMGSDRTSKMIMIDNSNFNPRSPHGERHTHHFLSSGTERFQSTLPAWGATTVPSASTRDDRFQSTLPAWGATTRRKWNYHHSPFQSTLPAWGATYYDDYLHLTDAISIHAPRMGSDGR